MKNSLGFSQTQKLASFPSSTVYAQLNLYSANRIKSLFPNLTKDYANVPLARAWHFLPSSASVPSVWPSLRSWHGPGCPAGTEAGNNKPLHFALWTFSQYSILQMCMTILLPGYGRFCAGTSLRGGARRWCGGRGRSMPATWTSTSTTRRRTSTRTPSGKFKIVLNR